MTKKAGIKIGYTDENDQTRYVATLDNLIYTLQGQGITFGPDVPWSWHRDAKGRRVAYVTLDASGTRQQGPGARRAEGRMAYVGGVYNPPPPAWLRPGGPAPPVQARYVSGLYAWPRWVRCSVTRRRRWACNGRTSG